MTPDAYTELAGVVCAAVGTLTCSTINGVDLRHQALSEAAAASVCRDAVAVVNTHSLSADQVRLVLDGLRVPPYHYSITRQLKVVHRDLIDRERLNWYFRRGATVVVDDLQSTTPQFDRLCSAITDQCGQPASATLFISPSHSEGFALHQDAEDAVIVQLAGFKTWSISTPLVRKDSSMLKLSECPEALASVTLSAGDVLLLPKGTPHKTVSDGGEGSVHLTLGLYPPTFRDLLARVAQLIPDNRFDDAVRNSLRLTELLKELASSGTVDTLASQAMDELRSGLRGDTSKFGLDTADPLARDGGSYILIRDVTESVVTDLGRRIGQDDLAARLPLVNKLSTVRMGSAMTYSWLADGVSPVVAQETLHELLRMRVVVADWTTQGER